MDNMVPKSLEAQLQWSTRLNSCGSFFLKHVLILCLGFSKKLEEGSYCFQKFLEKPEGLVAGFFGGFFPPFSGTHWLGRGMFLIQTSLFRAGEMAQSFEAHAFLHAEALG